MIKNIKLKKFLQNKLFPLFSFINKILPHKDNYILLYSNMGFRDNILALYNYLIKSEYNKNTRLYVVLMIINK